MKNCSLVKRMREQAPHLGAEEFPNGELMEEGASALEQALAALAVAREALERCYNVTTYPGDGTSRQDQAIAAIDATLGRASPQPLPDRDGEVNRG